MIPKKVRELVKNYKVPEEEKSWLKIGTRIHQEMERAMNLPDFDESDKICPCGNVDCSRIFGHDSY